MKSYLPPLKSLQYFMLAGKLSSFKRAASELNISQAAVSQQIKQLESYLGLSLFERNNRETKLTVHGARLLPYIEEGFLQWQRGLASITDDNQTKVLRISAIHSFTSIFLLPRLPQFQKAHPELMVQIAPSNDLVDFKNDEIDLAIRMGSGNYQGLHEKKIMSDHLIFVVSPDLLEGRSNADAKYIFSLPWIEDPSKGTHDVLDEACSQFHINKQSLTPTIRSNNSMMLIENALAGRGFTLVNKGLVTQYLASGELVQVLGFEAVSPWSLYLVAPKQNFEWKKVKAFEQWLVPLIKAHT
ncbi:LysR substrate-binding domain-containing protein [Glaciecola siphonariae]|uniref:LysR substrate-binding domain-containing protein n=1 Tax=Glaciecola siphonariae TaxID=521012 RepID=A0ABV9LSD2_9ALTE